MGHKIKYKNSIALSPWTNSIRDASETQWWGWGKWQKRLGQSHWYWRISCLWYDPDYRDCSLQYCLGPENQSSIRAVHRNWEEETWKGLSRYLPSSVFPSHPCGHMGRAFSGGCHSVYVGSPSSDLLPVFTVATNPFISDFFVHSSLTENLGNRTLDGACDWSNRTKSL